MCQHDVDIVYLFVARRKGWKKKEQRVRERKREGERGGERAERGKE